MKVALLLLGLVALCIATSEVEHKRNFLEFQRTYNKVYASTEEFNNRFAIFKANIARAAEIQKRETGSATYGITKFSDLTPEEFKAMYLNRNFSSSEWPAAPVAEKIELDAALPTNFDWSSKGAITPVKNQEQCGSCWAFSATETIESYWILAGNSQQILAPQQIVDCDTNDYGCNGGWPYTAYQYVISQGGMDTEAQYPYTAVDGTCNAQSPYAAHISNWQYVTQSQDETQIQNWVYSKGPCSICVDASSWQYYSGGVMSTCTQNIDHCVQLTGFSAQSGTAAWNVRNSWGTDWGVNGYIYLARGSDVCAMAQVVTAVSV